MLLHVLGVWLEQVSSHCYFEGIAVVDIYQE
jgi:hypothetical protein